MKTQSTGNKQMTALLLCCISYLQEKLKFNNFKGKCMQGLVIFSPPLLYGLKEKVS